MIDNIGIVTQARTGSSRLPQKILHKILNKSILEYHIRGLRKSNYPIYIATTSLQNDDLIENYAVKNNLPYHRGSELDVLKRYSDLALKFGLKHIVRVTSDCPLIDGELINQAIIEYNSYLNDHEQVYLSNTINRTFPRGFDFEIFSTQQLLNANENATLPEEREHVTPYIWREKIDNVKIVQYQRSVDKSKYRITLDTKEDLKLINALIVDHNAAQLNVDEVIEIMDCNPTLHEINCHIEQIKIENSDIFKGRR